MNDVKLLLLNRNSYNNLTANKWGKVNRMIYTAGISMPNWIVSYAKLNYLT